MGLHVEQNMFCYQQHWVTCLYQILCKAMIRTSCWLPYIFLYHLRHLRFRCTKLIASLTHFVSFSYESHVWKVLHIHMMLWTTRPGFSRLTQHVVVTCFYAILMPKHSPKSLQTSPLFALKVLTTKIGGMWSNFSEMQYTDVQF